jgi:hypothetical protein
VIRMLGYLLRFLAFLLLIRFVLRAVAVWLAPRPSSSPARPPAAPVQDLVRDRVCNTFVARDRAIVAVVSGREEHFCSTACRDKAILALSRAAS